MWTVRANLTWAGLAGCLALVLAGGAPAAAQTPQAEVAGQPAPPDALDYQLGSGDKVRVTVYGEESLSGEFLVAGNGRLSMPLIGEVKAAGLTVKSFQDEVQRILSDGYLKQPRVSAEVLTYRPFFILGEVSKPGQYPYTSGLTVLNAVATAGGFTYRANKGRVYIKHNNQTTEQAFQLQGTTPVAPGDTIRIGERFF
jgi:protein involved in polysaccharide export with SLBB domain